MRSVVGVAVLGMLLLGGGPEASAVKGPKTGIFGTINGMKVAATGKAVRKGLVLANYTVNPTGGVSFVLTGSEFPKRRGAYQILVIGCASETANLPWTAYCTGTYSEVRTQRRKLDQKIWGDVAASTDASFNIVTPFQVTVDSFDGSMVKGSYRGSFDAFQTSCPNGACVDAPELGTVSGEGTFAVQVGF